MKNPCGIFSFFSVFPLNWPWVGCSEFGLHCQHLGKHDNIMIHFSQFLSPTPRELLFTRRPFLHPGWSGTSTLSRTEETNRTRTRSKFLFVSSVSLSETLVKMHPPPTSGLPSRCRGHLPAAVQWQRSSRSATRAAACGGRLGCCWSSSCWPPPSTTSTATGCKEKAVLQQVSDVISLE